MGRHSIKEAPIPGCFICKTSHRSHIEEEMLRDPSKENLKKLCKLDKRITQTKVLAHMRKCLGRPVSHPDYKDIQTSRKSARQSIEALYQSPEVNTQMVLAEQQFQAVNAPLELLKAEASAIRETAMERNQLTVALRAVDSEARLIETQVKIAAEMRAQEMHNEILQKREWAKTQKFIWDFMEDHNLVDEFWDGLAAIGTSGRR